MEDYMFYVVNGKFATHKKFLEILEEPIDEVELGRGIIIDSIIINGRIVKKSKEEIQIEKQYDDLLNYNCEEYELNNKEYLSLSLPLVFTEYYINISEKTTTISAVGKGEFNLEFMLKSNPMLKNGILTFEKRKIERKIKHFY